jgi:antitoxin VapB
MNIASPKVHELAQRLARLTGEDVETALERAVEERLSRVSANPPQGDRHEAMRTFFDRISRMTVTDSRSADEIIGYGSDGLPR